MMMRSVSGWPSCIGVMSHNLAIYASSNNSFIFFNDTATTEIYTLSLHDALPVVFHVKLNTPGQSDGSQTVWINGVKKLDQQHMRWRTTTDLRLNEIRFDNYMPGGLRTQHVWVDDVLVWSPFRSPR